VSQQNVERLQVVYAEWAKGNFHAGLDLLDPAVVFRAKEFTPAGERVLVECRQSAIGKRSGAQVDMDIFAIWTFREGRVTEIRWLRNRGKALDAAGLKE
jgi:ketosteroid isomerase-like protein